MQIKEEADGQEITRQALQSLTESTRAIGRIGLTLTEDQIDDLARATRFLLNAIEVKKRATNPQFALKPRRAQ